MENSDPIDMNTLGNALANGDNDCKSKCKNLSDMDELSQ